MGCFSYMCKECGKPILSTSFAGQRVKLFLLENGKVLQEMEGEYDSYGRVFIDDSQRGDVEHDLRESAQWDPYNIGYDPETYNWETDHDPWHDCCNLHFDDDPSNGMAAVHTKCWTGNVPTTQSEDDPNQGWGEDWEYFADTDDEEIA